MFGGRRSAIDSIRAGAVVLVLSVAVGSGCGRDTETPEPAASSDERFPPEECGEFAVDEIGPADDWGQLTFFGISDVAPGGTVELEWMLNEVGPVSVSAAPVVECWTGSEWRPAWTALHVYVASNAPDVQPVSTAEAAERSTQTTGRLLVPKGAEAGSYRVVDEITICDTERDCETHRGEARFTIGST